MDRSYFERLYGQSPDPWGFDTLWYERRKYALTVATLPLERYRRAVEPGCANGALTELLAPRCDELIAYDMIDEAVLRATERLHALSHVEVRRERFPQWWPSGTGDLVVWSEIAYYLDEQDGERALTGLDRFLEPGGHLAAVHYTGTTNYPRRGVDIAPWLDGVGFLQRLVTHRDATFELGVWERKR